MLLSSPVELRDSNCDRLLLSRSHEVFRNCSRRRSTRKSFADSSYQDDLIRKNHTATNFAINSEFVISFENLVFVPHRLPDGWFSQGHSLQIPSAELAFGRILAGSDMRVSNVNRTAAKQFIQHAGYTSRDPVPNERAPSRTIMQASCHVGRASFANTRPTSSPPGALARRMRSDLLQHNTAECGFR